MGQYEPQVPARRENPDLSGACADALRCVNSLPVMIRAG